MTRLHYRQPTFPVTSQLHDEMDYLCLRGVGGRDDRRDCIFLVWVSTVFEKMRARRMNHAQDPFNSRAHPLVEAPYTFG